MNRSLKIFLSAIRAIFKEVLKVEYEDGLIFDSENIKTEIIAEDWKSSHKII